MSSPPPPPSDAGRSSPSHEKRRRRSISPPSARNCPRPDHLRSSAIHKPKRSDSKKADRTPKKSRSRRASKKHAKNCDADEHRGRRSRKESVATIVGDGLKTPLLPSSSSPEAVSRLRQSPPAKRQELQKEEGRSPKGDNPDRHSDAEELKTQPKPRKKKSVVDENDRQTPSDAPSEVSTPGKRLASAAASSDGDDDEDGASSKRQKTDSLPAPEFGLSGRLAADTNTVNGVVLKYSEPPEARRPGSAKWRIYVFKDDKDIDMHHVDSASGYLFGRDRK
ncbi:hypothetical protein LPJ59_007062, partial [Coemansia sp. RSA 2399]